MITQRVFSGLLLAATLLTPAVAEVYPVILHGKVTMADGTPPPKSVSIQRICSDESGSAPGPLTDKKGDFIWRMDVDPMRTRACHLEAQLPGFVSTRLDISGLNGYTDTAQTLPPIVLTSKTADPYTIMESDKDVPGKSMPAWKSALKNINDGKVMDAIAQLQIAVKNSPKFANGWHTMGILYQSLGMAQEAKDAWQHAVEADPKLLPAYLGLARMCLATKDWQCVSTTSDDLIRVDVKKIYLEIYLHQAVARYQLKNLDGAMSSAQDSIRLDAGRKRNEYVLGRILEAKGDTAGAAEHMAKYIAAAPTAPDIDLVKKHLEYLGKPEAASVDPDLE